MTNTESVVARYNTSEAASQSATLRTAEARGSATFTTRRDVATDTYLVIQHANAEKA